MNVRQNKRWGSLGGALIAMLVFSACRTGSGTPAEQKGDQAADMSVKVQTLQKQLRERDKRIQELESQLDALKLIEQDFENQRKPIRPPATLKPIERP